GGIGVAVNRPHVNGVVVIAVDEHSGPKGQTSLTVEPYLRADDGKPILVAVVIYGKIAITDYFHGKVSQANGRTIFYANTSYSKSTINTVTRAHNVDTVLDQVHPEAAIEGNLKHDPYQFSGSIHDAVVRRGFWVNVGSVEI